jgi:hypothetical protein
VRTIKHAWAAQSVCSFCGGGTRRRLRRVEGGLFFLRMTASNKAFLSLPLTLLLAAIFFWCGNRTFFNSRVAPWLATSQTTVAAQPTCSLAATAAAKWNTAFPSEQLARDFSSFYYAGKDHARFDLLPPLWAAPTKRYGDTNDGGKLLLDLGSLHEKGPPCAIYSLGSNNQVDFEVSMLSATRCDVFTFDCTVAEGVMARTIAAIPGAAGRLHFFPYCLGPQGSAARFGDRTVSLRSLSSIMLELGHAEVTLLKMDIEGGEHDALGPFLKGGTGLPRQISMELHLHKSYLQSFDAVKALVDAGYVLFSREDNPLCDFCTELSWVRGCS